MSDSYGTARCKSASSGSPLLRARIAEELANLLAENSQRNIGAGLGVAGSTILRRGEDIAQWPASDLLTLAVQFPRLSDAIVACLEGRSQPHPEATAAMRDSFQTAAACADLTRTIVDAVADGRFTPAEAEAIRTASDRLSALLPVLLRDVAAAVGDRR